MKTLKRAMALIFVFILSINSFAAIVSDNDGSAFVTKAEFEALKKNFNKQIDDYNSSLTGKVDGAIASYLAGIAVSKVTEYKANVISLEYPLTIYDYNSIVSNVQRTDTADFGKSDSLWAPSYKIFFYLGNRTLSSISQIKKDQQDRINTWIWGYKLNDSTFKARGKATEVKGGLVTTYTLDNYRGGVSDTQWPSGFAFADQSAMTASWDAGNGSTNTRTVRNNFAINYKSTDTEGFNFDAGYAHNKTYSQFKSGMSWQGSTTNGAYYDKLKFTGESWYGGSGHTATAYNGFNSWTSSSKTGDKINIIFNDRPSTDTMAPVCYTDDATSTNAYVWYTNKKQNRFVVNATQKITWQSRTKTAHTDYGIGGVVTAGENLEDENENTSRNWYNKSLIKATRIVYDVKTNDKTVAANHKMVEGIPIYVFDKKYPDGQVKKTRLTIKIKTNEYTDATKLEKSNLKICFSKKAIPLDSAIDIESSEDYLKVVKYTNNTAQNGKKMITVKPEAVILGSEQTFEFDDTLNEESTLYLKLLWDEEYASGSTKYYYSNFIISEDPQITITFD